MASTRTVRAAGYERVSTDEQAREGFSLEAQARRIRGYCTSKGWRLVRLYRDEGHTGLDADRGDYERLLQDEGRYDVIVFTRIDRLHRRRRNFDAFMDWCREHGKDWVAMDQGFDTTTAMGRFLVDFQARMAELESDQLGERVRPAMEAAKDAGIPQGRDYLGFEFVRSADRRGGTYKPTAWGQSVYNRAKRENVDAAREAHPYPSGKKQGKVPSRSAVYRLLRNFRLYEDGQLLPNRERTPPGTHSKFTEARP